MNQSNNRRGLAILAGGLAFVGSVPAMDLIVNGSFENPQGPEWVGYYRTYNFSAAYYTGPPIPISENPGTNYSWRHGLVEGDYSGPCVQTVDVTAGAPATEIDAGRGQYTFSAWLASYGQPGSNPEQPYVTLQFYDGTGTNQLGSTVALDRVFGAFFVQFADGVTTFDSGVHLHAWAKYLRTSSIPPGARTARVGVTRSPHAGLSGTPDTYTDLVKLDVIATETRPSLESVFPVGTGAPGAGAVHVALRDGSIAVNTNTIVFTFDGTNAPAAISRTGPVTLIQFDPGVLAAGSAHTFSVVFTDNGVPPLSQTNSFAFTVANYVTLPAAYARPPGSASTPGFTHRTVWAGGPALPNTLDRAKAQLDGRLIDPITSLPYPNAATPGPHPDGAYDVDTVVNFEQSATAAGNFPGDQAFPGLAAGDSEGFATESLHYLELPAGYYRFGVNSDDGFEVSAGTWPQDALAPRTVLGLYDDGRATADTSFDFLVPTSGVYPVRLIFEEGSGGASLEFFSVNPVTAQKILINDLSDTNAIRSYRVLTGAAQPPYLRYVQPAPGATDVPVDTGIRVDLWDRATAVVLGTVQLTLNGDLIAALPSKNGIVTTISYQPPSPLAFGATNTLRLVYGDGVMLFTNTWSFVTRGAIQAPGITGQWDFDAGDLSATIGLPLEYLGGTNGPSAGATQFGTTTSFGLPDLNGAPARVMRFSGAVDNTLGYVMKHGAVPNGGSTATKVNQWTLIMDLLIATPGWFSFLQIDSPANSNDGELFANPANGIGVSGEYHGNLTRGEWHRVAFAVNASNIISKYIDGVKVADQSGWDGAGFDGRHAMLSTAVLFGDNDGDGQPCYLNSVQFRNYKMLDREIAALAGPDAGGIPSVGGQWDFNDQSTFESPLDSTLGADMTLLPGTEFGTSFDTVMIGSENANVMRFLAADIAAGYVIVPGSVPNGGGQKINRYTLVMDVMFPAESADEWRALWQTRTNNTDDASLFISPDDGVGVSSNYVGNLLPSTWYRLGFTFDLTSQTLKRYINGAAAGPMTLGEGVDGRWAVDATALLFADNDGDTAAGFCNSIQFRPVVLTDEEMARLGPPSAAGIPLALPTSALRITRIARLGGDFVIEWSGGNAPFQVQFKVSLSAPTWTDVGSPTSSRTATVPGSASTGFIRVAGQ